MSMSDFIRVLYLRLKSGVSLSHIHSVSTSKRIMSAVLKQKDTHLRRQKEKDTAQTLLQHLLQMLDKGNVEEEIQDKDV